MNKYVFDEDDNFLIVETKWGTIRIEQSKYRTSVVLIENNEVGEPNSSHLEYTPSVYKMIVCMVSDNEPE